MSEATATEAGVGAPAREKHGTASFEKGVNALRQVLDAPTASFFASCVHCGLCAEACLFYTETGDPKYTPIHKLEPLKRLWKQENTLVGWLGAKLGVSKPVTDEELGEWSELVYDSCTLCGRCSMVCPVGNDISGMVRRMREGMAVAGHAPPGVVDATRRTVEQGSPMGVKLATLQAQIRHQEQETGLEIPVDREGAEFLVLLSSMEVVNYPEYLGALARIFKKADISWTLSSQAFEATNSGIQIGVSDIAAEILQRIVDAAEGLKVKAVLSPECGHAYYALRWEGPNLIGRQYRFDVVQVTELLDELQRTGRLPLTGQEEEPLTYHDPCQIVRRGGVVDAPRNLLNVVASDFREMEDHGAMNWCCGGGGGVSANERANELRTRVFTRKKAQLDALHGPTLVTGCANCRIMLEEGLEHYNMDIEVVGLTETLANHLDES